MSSKIITDKKGHWAIDTIIISIDGEKQVFHAMHKLSKVLKIISNALVENKSVNISILPVGTNLEFTGSLDTIYSLNK